MAFLGLCKGAKDDPVLKELREVFSANVLRVPGEHVRPLDVVAMGTEGSRHLGELVSILEPDPPLHVPPKWLEDARRANVSGQRTRAVNIDLGLKIMEGFFAGFGIDGGSIGTSFKTLKQISFSFQDVHQNYIQINRIGRLVAGKKVDTNNPVSQIFQGPEPSNFLVIDSVIQSNNFSVHVKKSDAADFKISVPEVTSQLGTVKLTVETTGSSEDTVTFQGDKFLTFAFSCVRFYPNETGTIEMIAPEYRDVSLASRGIREVYNPNHVLLSFDEEDPVMIDL